MLKVLIIFALIVVIMMLCSCHGSSSSSSSGGSESLSNSADVKAYTSQHSRSIQDDIKKVVSKNI